MSFDDLTKQLVAFRDARQWAEFHSPRNLASSVAIEAAELLEHFQWSNPTDADEVMTEVADVVIYCVLLAHSLNRDLGDAIAKKVESNAIRYPAK